MSGNTVGLYGSTTTANVAGGNVTGLYQQTQAVVVDNGYNNADVEAFLETYTGNIQCGNIDVLNTANINALFATNYYYANGTPFVPSGYGNANVAAFLPTYTGDLAGSNLGITANILVGQNLTTSGNITSAQNITAGGDVQAAGNLRTTGAAGNITGANYVVAGFFVGDGSQLSNISGSYGNAQVANLLASGTLTSNVITTGNISGTYFLGNGSQLTGLPETYSNANVTTLLANFGSNTIVTTGNITGGVFTGSGAGLSAIAGANVSGQVANALVAGTVYTAAQPAITSVGTLTSLAVAGNISTGNIEATGNVTVGGTLHSDDITSVGDVTVYGNQIITGNLTVQGNTTTINSNVITTNDKTITVANNQSTGANVNGAGIEAGNPAIATWLYNDPTTSWQSNISVTPSANLTQDLGKSTNRWATVYAGDANISANVTAVGNISGSYILGNGSQLTGLPEGYGNANVVTLLANFGSNTISTTGNITGGNINTTGRVLATTLEATGLVKGNGSALTSITGSAVTGTVALAAQANIANTANSVSGANVVGAVANATYATSAGTADSATTAVTVTGNAQANITSVGTLTTLSVAGNITSSGNISGSYILGNGSQLTGLPATYGNANVESLLAGYTANILTTGTFDVNNTVDPIAVTITGRTDHYGDVNILTGGLAVSTGIITGNGSGLTNIPGANVTGQVANALVAGTVYTAAQPNITSVGTLTSLSVTGNVTGGNINTAGNVSGSYIFGNGSQLTGITTSYNNSNVTTLLAALGSNIISSTANITTTGNVSGGNVISGAVTYTPVDGTAGQILTTYGNGITYWTSGGGGSYGNAEVSAYLASGTNTANIVTTGNISGGNVIATTAVKSGAVTITGTDGTAGQVLTTYGNGVTYFSTVSGGGGSLSGNLAGNIFANGFAITSTSNGNVTLTADGTGLVNISKANLQTYREVVYAVGSTSGNLAANVDVLNGSIQTITLTGNVTLDSITNIAAGQNITLILTQDGTGNRVLSSTMKYAGGYKILSTAANATDILSVFYDGTNYWASLNIGYA